MYVEGGRYSGEVDDLLLGGVAGGLGEDAVHEKQGLDFAHVLLFAVEWMPFGGREVASVARDEMLFREVA